MTFGGANVDLGASFIHYPGQDDFIHPLALNYNIGQYKAGFDQQTELYVNRSIFKPSDVTAGAALFNKAKAFLDYQVKNTYSNDLPLKTVLDQFWSNPSNRNPKINPIPIQDLAKQYFYKNAADDGANLTTQSTFYFDGAIDGK